jgi:hypothetical protein
MVYLTSLSVAWIVCFQGFDLHIGLIVLTSASVLGVLFLYSTKQLLYSGNQQIGPALTTKMDEVPTSCFDIQKNHAGM